MRRRFGRISFTGRAAVLAVVLAALAIALAEPMRQWLAQRNQIAEARQQVEATKRQVAALQSARQRWADPSYVADQARTRLHYVRPGEIPYITIGPTPSPSAVPSPRSDDATAPWYAQLWGSIQAAGTATHGATAPPHPSPTPSPPTLTPAPVPRPSAP